MAPAQAGEEIIRLPLRAGQLPYFFFFFVAPATTVLPAKCWTLKKDKGSSQKFAHRGQTKELSYGTLPPPPVLKRKCDRQWEKCMADGFNSPGSLQRSSLTTHKGVHQMLVIDRRYRFPMKSSFFVSTSSNNVVCLMHAGTLPWRYSVHCE